MERIGRSEEEGKTKQGREPSKINGFLQLQMRRIDFASGRQRKEREFRGAFPRHPIDLLAGNVSIDSGDIFVNRAQLPLSDLIPRVESCSSVTLPFEAIEPSCHGESSGICQLVEDIS